MFEGGRSGGDNKTEEIEITMQDEEGMMRKKKGVKLDREQRELKKERGCIVQ